MKIYTDYENLVIITSKKTIHIDLPMKINKSLKSDLEFTIKSQ